VFSERKVAKISQAVEKQVEKTDGLRRPTVPLFTAFAAARALRGPGQIFETAGEVWGLPAYLNIISLEKAQ
jgi:hypothetical protein